MYPYQLLQISDEVKLVRRRWKLTIPIGTSVARLFNAVSDIPREAKVVDVDEYDGNSVFVFELEEKCTATEPG